ncbi:hypothetical protein NL50_17810 [Clostridium acetobutylicum]|nr:hypothetical protein NL50_17810 [Clostridium acetobutylicum]
MLNSKNLIAYIGDDNYLNINRVGFIYKLGTEKLNKRAIQALKLDREKNLITDKEFLEAMKTIRGIKNGKFNKSI